MYGWVKAVHLIFMVTWFAGLFYLPRLFVYHAMSDDETSRERFKVMERKLYYGIMAPSAILTLLCGVWLITLVGFDWFFATRWIQIKVTLIAVLTAYHLYLGHLVGVFKRDRNVHGHVYYRWINEFPVIILFGVVLLAVLKPF